jgi:putative transposase
VLRAIQDDASEEKISKTGLDELAREGARRMLLKALEAEVGEYIERHEEARDEKGHALVVRNGLGRARKVTTGAGRWR